jgi:hypothetical protein
VILHGEKYKSPRREMQIPTLRNTNSHAKPQRDAEKYSFPRREMQIPTQRRGDAEKYRFPRRGAETQGNTGSHAEKYKFPHFSSIFYLQLWPSKIIFKLNFSKQ